MKTTNISYPQPTGWKNAERLISLEMHRTLIFITFLKENILARKPQLAIFAIPKNDVVRANFEGWIGSSVG